MLDGIQFNVDGFIEKLEPVFAAMAAKLGTSTEFLFEVGVRKQVADGILGAIAAGAGVLMVVSGLVMLALMLTKKIKCDFANKDRYCPGCASCILAPGYSVVALLLGTAITIAGTKVAVPHLVAPEWMLIQEILQMVTRNGLGA